MVDSDGNGVIDYYEFAEQVGGIPKPLLAEWTVDAAKIQVQEKFTTVPKFVLQQATRCAAPGPDR